MSDQEQTPKPKKPMPSPLSERERPCLRCGAKRFREASKIEREGKISLMYECLACGEYQL
jgi:hypothetical protein